MMSSLLQKLTLLLLYKSLGNEFFWCLVKICFYSTFSVCQLGRKSYNSLSGREMS